MEAKSSHLKLQVRPIAGIEELRRLVLDARKAAAATSFASAGPKSGPEGSELEALLARAPEHADALAFSLNSRVPLVGFAITAAKKLLRRLARTYLDRQSAVNEYLLALAAATAREQLRVAARQDAEITDLRVRFDALISRIADQANLGEMADPTLGDRGAGLEVQQALGTRVPLIEDRAGRDVSGDD